VKTSLACKTLFSSGLSLIAFSLLCGAWQLTPANMLPAKAQTSANSGNPKNDSVNSPTEQIQMLVTQSKYKQANSVFVENVPDMKSDFSKAWPLRYFFEKSFYRKSREVNGDDANSHRWQNLLEQKKYAELEKSYDDLVASKSQRADGDWNASFLINSLGLAEKPTDDEWEPYITKIHSWLKARPNSCLAKLLLAKTMTEYAWHARGSGYANTVTTEGGKLFSTRLEEARAILSGISVRTPNWYPLSQKVALGQGLDKANYDKMVEEGRKKFPEFTPIVTSKFHYLLPRWYGQEGDAERYLESECKKLDKVHGDMLYAQAAVREEKVISNAMNSCAFSWPRTKAGMLTLIQKYPDWIYGRCMYSILAMEVGDKATANTAFDVSGKK
jgi:hypothetical protein